MITNYRFIDQYASEDEGKPVLTRPKVYFDYLSGESNAMSIDDKLTDLGSFIVIGGDLRSAIARYRNRYDTVYASSLHDTLLRYVIYLRMGEATHALYSILKGMLNESQLIDLLNEELKLRTQKKYDKDMRHVGYELSNINANYDFDKYLNEYNDIENKKLKLIFGEYMMKKTEILNDTQEKLFTDNPWVALAERIEGNNYVLPKDCLHPEDKLIVNEFNSTAKKEHRLILDIAPEPFTGNPLTAEVVILTLNPGFVEKCNYGIFNNLDMERQEAYIKSKCKMLRLQENVCVSDNADILDIEEHYWERKLKSVLKMPNVNTKIALVQYLAYQSEKYKDIPKKLFGKDTDLLYTQKYTIRLVKFLMEQGKVIVIARNKRNWYRHVPDLENYKKKVLLKNYRNTVISLRNCVDDGFELIKKVLSK